MVTHNIQEGECASPPVPQVYPILRMLHSTHPIIGGPFSQAPESVAERTSPERSLRVVLDQIR